MGKRYQVEVLRNGKGEQLSQANTKDGKVYVPEKYVVMNISGRVQEVKDER